MPRLIRLYLVNIGYGFLLAAIFTAALIGFDIAGLRHLVTSVASGWIAVVMLLFFHTVLFAGVQFAIAVMRMAEAPQGPHGGRRIRAGAPSSRPARAVAPARR